MLVSRLSLGAKIGNGSFGEVFEGEDPVHGKVAVKVIERLVGEAEDSWLQRKDALLDEGRRLKDAEHRNVVRIYHLVEADHQDAILLVMEYCDGGSLDDRYKAGPVAIADLREILTQAAMGLHAIHEREMLHRDIKPANILLNAEDVAKIADFGLVTDDIQFGYANAAGYLPHLAKEVFDRGLTSTRTDVWAFGMTAYRLLHGHTFYRFALPSDVPAQIRRGGFASRLPWLPHVPDRWRRFVRKAMHDDPDMRFQNAVEIMRSLERLPVAPSWECTYTSSEVAWNRTSGSRRIVVRWTVHSPRRHEWEAVSYPLGEGRQYTLGGSDGLIGKRQVHEELTRFFERA